VSWFFGACNIQALPGDWCFGSRSFTSWAVATENSAGRIENAWL